MNNAVFQLMVQATSILALTGGLIYAALQFRGWRTAQYVTNFTELVKLQLELRKMVVDDPTLAIPGLGVPPGTRPEDIRSDFYNLMQLSLFEIAWFSHSKGQLTDNYFKSWVTNMAEVALRPAFHAMWQSNGTKIMHDGFRQYMNTFMGDTVVPRTCSASRALGDTMKK
jgi:hypothetical protein